MIHMGNTLESLENEYNVICDQQAKIAAQVQTVKAQLAELQRRNGELLERRHIVATLMKETRLREQQRPATTLAAYYARIQLQIPVADIAAKLGVSVPYVRELISKGERRLIWISKQAMRDSQADNG
jgi:cell division protein ZapA (FtsZ GTPase activity inhibitor)